MTAVAVDGQQGKEYRLPTGDEIVMASDTEREISKVFAGIPYGLAEELVPKGGSGASRAFSVDGYGFDQWYKLFTPRQLLALGTFVKYTRAVSEAMQWQEYPAEWVETVSAYLASIVSRLLDFCNSGVQWKLDATTINHYFVRFALPIVWDFAEGNTIGNSAGSYKLCFERICTALDTYDMWNID